MLHCPMCGSDDAEVRELASDGKYRFAVVCEDCGLQTSPREKPEAAKQDWQKRFRYEWPFTVEIEGKKCGVWVEGPANHSNSCTAQLACFRLQANRKFETVARQLGWLYEDELPDYYPYEKQFPLSKVIDGVRMFPPIQSP